MIYINCDVTAPCRNGITGEHNGSLQVSVTQAPEKGKANKAIIAVLAAMGAKDPTAIISTTIIATFCGTVAAVTTSKLLQRFFPYEEEAQVE